MQINNYVEEKNEALIHSLWDVHHKMRNIHDGKASQGRILIILRENGAMTQRAMTEHLDIKPGSASEVITKLEKSGLLIRMPNKDDHRTVDLILTEKGRLAADEAKKQRQILHEEMLACLNEQEKDELSNLLNKLQSDWTKRFPRCVNL